MHPHEAALALIGLFQEGESIADFQEGGFLEGGSDPFERKKERKKEREKLWGLRAVIVVVAVPICSSCVHDFENVICPNFGVRALHEVCRLCCWIHPIVLH
jgi:hypothetical protein